MKKKILIAEDDKIIRDVLVEHLELEGYEVCVAADGKEAVQVACEEKPDLVIMDIFMPNMDGWEATKIIKANKDLAHTLVICLSAYTSPENTERSIEVQCDLVLVKPLYPDALKKHIKTLLFDRACDV